MKKKNKPEPVELDVNEKLLKMAHVCKMLAMTAPCVKRYDNELLPFRLPSGHRRYKLSNVKAFLKKYSV